MKTIMNIGIITLIAATAVGCAPQQANIVDLQNDKVVVRTNRATNFSEAMVDDEAMRGCAIHNKKATRVSVLCRDEYCFIADAIYSCTEEKKSNL